MFQYNEVYDGLNGYMDGEAFDIDIGCENVVYQYNFSHDNNGGLCLFMNGLKRGNKFRYNISKNDGHGTEIFHNLPGSENEAVDIYNNTIYIGEGIDVNYLFHQTVGGRKFPYANFINNIVQVDGNLRNFAGDRNGNTTQPAQGVYKNNIIYPAQFAALKGAPLEQPGLITEKPMLASPQKELKIMDTWTSTIWKENIENFKLQPISPAINTGIEISEAGEKDIYGYPLYNGLADRGAHEFNETYNIVEGIKLDTQKMSIEKGSKRQIKATVLPQNATNKQVTWASSNSNIVQVDVTGLITAKQIGTATLTVTTVEGNYTATMEITVKYPDSDSDSDSTENNGSSSDLNKESETKENASTSEKKDKTIEEQWKNIKAEIKKEIQEKLNKELPYTLLAKNYTIEELNKLTNNQFTTKQLEEIQQDMSILKDLGISINSEVVNLKGIENPVFKDVQETHWAYKDIVELAKLGVVTGDEKGNFKPKETLKVDDTFAFLDRVLLLNGITTPTLPKATVEKYITNKENWAYYSMLSIGSKLSEDTLKIIGDLGDESLSRQLLAQVLYEVTKGELPQTKPSGSFKDVTTSQYKNALDYCVKTGLLQGTSTNTMSPTKEVTRAEMMAILQRLYTLLK